MHILLSNDDGYLAPGIRHLKTALSVFGQVTVVAPDRNRSAASSSLTLLNPIRAIPVEENVLKVDGTPTDCVHLAVTGLLSEEPDMVVSGINHGANLGDDVIYSGTVAAAIEGRFFGYPALAVSLVDAVHGHFETASAVVNQVIRRLIDHPLPPETILNINVPDLPLSQLKGIKATRLGNRHKSEPVIKAEDPRGMPIYWIGPAGPKQDAGPGTDFHAVENGYASITPIKIDLTRHELIKELDSWIQEIEVK
ncbi:MAG: 5'/3'-nucleotidase SurE [Gammaproteobacteria bacterium]|nr:5'/3'-nucleotidase SurE [Gammaproteobacteria bacterium]